MIPTGEAEGVAEINRLSAMAYHYAALEPQIGAKVMELRDTHHRAARASGANRQHLNDEGDFFDAVWQVVNWNDVATRLAAARRLEA